MAIIPSPACGSTVNTTDITDTTVGPNLSSMGPTGSVFSSAKKYIEVAMPSVKDDRKISKSC